MKFTPLLMALFAPLGALADSVETNESGNSVKISDTTEVYGNGITSSLLLAKFSKFQPVQHANNEKLNELEKMYANATVKMMQADIAHDEKLSEMSTVASEAEKAKMKYKNEVDKLRETLDRRLALGELEQSYYYATAEWELTDEQEKVLSVVFDAVSQMKNVTIEVVGRADPRGNKDYNQKLSEKRAEYIKDLAISKGISLDNITSKGLGEVGEIDKNRERLFFNRYTSVIIKK